MFKRYGYTEESILNTLREEAMEAEDYKTVQMLNDIESEMQSKLVKERIKGIFGGYGTAMAGITIGTVIAGLIKNKGDW